MDFTLTCVIETDSTTITVSLAPNQLSQAIQLNLPDRQTLHENAIFPKQISFCMDLYSTPNTWEHTFSSNTGSTCLLYRSITRHIRFSIVNTPSTIFPIVLCMVNGKSSRFIVWIWYWQTYFQKYYRSLRSTSISEKVKCLTCGKLYASKKSLKIHVRIHTGYKPYMYVFNVRAARCE